MGRRLVRSVPVELNSRPRRPSEYSWTLRVCVDEGRRSSLQEAMSRCYVFSSSASPALPGLTPGIRAGRLPGSPGLQSRLSVTHSPLCVRPWYQSDRQKAQEYLPLSARITVSVPLRSLRNHAMRFPLPHCGNCTCKALCLHASSCGRHPPLRGPGQPHPGGHLQSASSEGWRPAPSSSSLCVCGYPGTSSLM
ncbi:hypothetical protein H920_10625 [Fukomys damarensis]|uniref:Uncharacterized protein n=1 Tax=Fukomys damarensis TaxID=885580 RepID=A0A091D746_FUKDA|nr:hypothetical protein H920_10625 [Fukomys damarensis]